MSQTQAPAAPPQTETAARGQHGFAQLFSALRYPEFRDLWIGMLVSNIGSWVKMVAQGWLVYTLTDSPLYLGLVAFARAAPVLLLVPLTGVLADRFDRRWLMLIGTLIVTVTSTVMWALTLTGLVDVWHVILLSAITGVAVSLEMPSRQALVPEMVERKDIVNAVGLSAAAFNAAGVVGPAIAALIIESTGTAMAFLVSAVSNAGVAVALMRMRPVKPNARTEQSFIQNLVEGLKYVRHTPSVFGLMSLMVVFAMFGRPYVDLLPVFARDVLNIGASGLGMLAAAVGFGSLIGAMFVAVLGSFRRKGLIAVGSSMVCAALLIGFSLSRWPALSIALAPALGFFTIFYMVCTNTLIQTIVPGGLRGRVASLYGLIQMGLMPLGVMIEGAVGSVVGVPETVFAGALLVLSAACIGLVRIPALRRIE